MHQQELQVADEEYVYAIQTSEEVYTQEELERHVLERKRIRMEERNHGQWDCIYGTYENPPYHPTCQMCHNKAPPTTVLTFLPVHKHLRFGVELEIVIPNGICGWF